MGREILEDGGGRGREVLFQDSCSQDWSTSLERAPTGKDSINRLSLIIMGIIMANGHHLISLKREQVIDNNSSLKVIVSGRREWGSEEQGTLTAHTGNLLHHHYLSDGYHHNHHHLPVDHFKLISYIRHIKRMIVMVKDDDTGKQLGSEGALLTAATGNYHHYHNCQCIDYNQYDEHQNLYQYNHNC